MSDERKTYINSYEIADGYLYFGLVSADGYSIDGLFRIYSPQDGKSMEIVSIEYGNAYPEVEEEWNLIKNELRENAKEMYYEAVKTLPMEERYREAMQLAGYEAVELQQDSLATVGYRNPDTGDEIYSDGWSGVVEHMSGVDFGNETVTSIVTKLCHPKLQIEYYVFNMDINEIVHGNLQDVVAQFREMKSLGKQMGVHITQEDGTDNYLMMVGQLGTQNGSGKVTKPDRGNNPFHDFK